MGSIRGIAEAADRLERAVLRLEAAVESMAETPPQRPDLKAALAAAKAQYASLAKLTHTVATRLDGAIHRLDSALEE